MTPRTDTLHIRRTRAGLRLSQHGVVLSELRTSPGPTHSVFDVLAAVVSTLAPAGRLGVLGFAGGAIMAPLRGLGVMATVHAVDLERAGYDLFCGHCHDWAGRLRWQQADAVTWLRRQPRHFNALVEDLSVPVQGDVFKPSITWSVLPELIRDRLAPEGIGVFNLLRPPGGTWIPEQNRIARLFKTAHVIAFDDFANCILVGGRALPDARALGRQLRLTLRSIRSRQAGRIHLRSLRQTRIAG